MKVSHNQLTLAREYRGWAQTKLSRTVQGLSQSNLSKFEKGLDGLSDETLEKIFNVLKFPEGFLERKISVDLETSNYRKKNTIPESIIQEFETSCMFIGYIIDEVLNSIDYLDFSLKTLNIEDGYTPEYIAQFTRKDFRIFDDEPIEDIFKIIEDKGIIIYELNANEKFDGISLFTRKGFPIVVLNKKLPNDRKRLTLAHELGHLIMHTVFPVPNVRDKEQEANDFASEFLMSERAIRNSLEGLKSSSLSALKSYWLTSKASIIRRTYSLGVINQNKYKYFSIELSRIGEKKNGKGSVSIDEAVTLDMAVRLHLKGLEYTYDDLANAFAPPEDVIQRCALKQNLFLEPKIIIN